VSKTGLIPAQAFEHERPYLHQLPEHLPAPYCSHERGTDEYGYVSFQGNYYWVPGTKREQVKLLEYADRVKIYQQRACVAEYPLPPYGVKNERFSPPGQPQPRHQPKNRKQGSGQEEQRLRALGPEVAAYVDYVLTTPGIQRHRYVRELFAFSRQVPQSVFVAALARALQYRVVHLETLRRIAWFCMSQSGAWMAEPEVDEAFRQRGAYQEGYLTDEPDLSGYDPPSREEETEETDQESEDENG